MPDRLQILEYHIPRKASRLGPRTILAFIFLPAVALIIVSLLLDPRTVVISGPGWSRQSAQIDKQRDRAEWCFYGGLAWPAGAAAIIFFVSVIFESPPPPLNDQKPDA